MTNVIVTGANRGIGHAICQLILSKQNIPNLKLLATSRQGEDLGLGPNVSYPSLDISNSESISSFATEVNNEHGEIDVLINNAGINVDASYGPQKARQTLDVNYRGTLEMCQTLIPLLSQHGRIVNLSSVASSLKPYSEKIQQRFRDPNMTLQDLEGLAQDFEYSVQTKTEAESGFVGPGRAYSFSKACVNALTRILAQQSPDLAINACCPGWVKTEMGLLVGRAPKTPQDGAKIPVRLAFEDIHGVTGRYWANASVRSKEGGEMQEW